MSAAGIVRVYDYVIPPSQSGGSYSHVILLVAYSGGPGAACGTSTLGMLAYVTIATTSSNDPVPAAQYMTGTFSRICPENVLSLTSLPGLTITWGETGTPSLTGGVTDKNFVVEYNGQTQTATVYNVYLSPGLAPTCDQMNALYKLSCPTCTASTQSTITVPDQATTTNPSLQTRSTLMQDVSSSWVDTHRTTLYIIIGVLGALFALGIAIAVIVGHERSGG
jgi:hypothetical protein